MKRALELRDLAKLVLGRRGGSYWTEDGVKIYFFDDDAIGITLQPAILGTSMPTMMEVRRKVDRLLLLGTDWYRDGREPADEILAYCPTGDWEARLADLATP